MFRSETGRQKFPQSVGLHLALGVSDDDLQFVLPELRQNLAAGTARGGHRLRNHRYGLKPLFPRRYRLEEGHPFSADREPIGSVFYVATGIDLAGFR
jgi:hypothetical protein